ncbi:hypothetical protein ACFXKX_17635 [Streptomyces scopuliridis]|uniref:hypothetical protein n=1 Tax=Streptomyces scopuliridis TaxID=452529 RepID=UPI00367D7906
MLRLAHGYVPGRTRGGAASISTPCCWAHWRAVGPLPTHLRERLHAYLIHIGLDAIVYCAFQRRWDEVRCNAGIVAAPAHSASGEYVLNPPTIRST